MVGALFDRDTAPGAGAEELLAMDIPSFIVPGDDDAHAKSAAMYYMNVCAVRYTWMLPLRSSQRKIFRHGYSSFWVAWVFKRNS